MLESVTFKARAADLGTRLARQATSVLEGVPQHTQGPIQLSRVLGIDKATASRLLRAAASRDPFAALQQIPGPEPLRGFAQSARRVGVSDAAIQSFLKVVREFETIIQEEAGDRSGFDSIIAAFLPEARDVFELKRKQAVFRAISQLKGVLAQTNLISAVIHPSANGESLDILWITSYLGLQRLRPGVPVRFSTRRVSTSHGPGTKPLPARRPLTLEGKEVEGLDGLILEDCCTSPTPQLEVRHAGDVMHYLLAGDAFGPRSVCDLAFAERNAEEVPRYITAPGKRRFVYTDVSIPVEKLIFDAIIHEDVLGRSPTQLLIYDTSTRGIADVNDPARDIDRVDLQETMRHLGAGIDRCRVSEVPWYDQLLHRTCESLGWQEDKLFTSRVTIDYPLHATQVAITYEAQLKS